MSDVSAVVRHFSISNEGFLTTLLSPITAGAATVPMASSLGLTDGSVFVGVIEPGTSKQQVFTGTVTTATNSIVNCKWTRGANIDHTAGVLIVDYVTGTDHNMTTKGVLIQHKQDGTHSAMTADSLNVTTLTINGKDSSQLTPSGIMNPYAGATPPTGWLLCDGSAVSRATYAALFTVTSTTYGVGDGSTTFNLPDMRGRTTVGADPTGIRNSVFNNLGQAFGEQTHTLTTTEQANASGSVVMHSAAAATNISTGMTGIVSGGTLNSNTYRDGGAAGSGAASYGVININLGFGNGAHNNMQPYQNFNYIIKV